MLALMTALTLALSPLQDPPASAAQTPPSQIQDILIHGRPLPQAAEEFVGRVAAPARRRGLAVWRDSLCLSAANMRADVAQAVIDHVAGVAADLGLQIGEPGCTANVVIVFSSDGRSMASQLIARDRQAFHIGVGSLDRGGAALRAFRDSERPVRWWHVSLPTDPETGRATVRLPGYDPQDHTVSLGPAITAPSRQVTASRLNAALQDNLNKVIVIVDVTKLGDTTTEQLADYVAFVVLAQTDPEAETGSFDTILNVFDAPGSTPGLTDWDHAYLEALYGPASQRSNDRARIDAMAGAMLRARERAAEAAATAGD